MVAKLIAEEGDLKGLELSFDKGTSWVIGRDPEQCQLVVEDPLASRRHLLATLTPKGISIENLSTTNPSQLNEEILNENEPRLLQNGDILKIGNESFRFYTDPGAHVIDTEEIKENSATKINGNPQNTSQSDEDEDSVFDASPAGIPSLADVNFGIAEIGRWLLKVIGGPNAGAEFYMQTGSSYVIGTDPHTCDIVFHDTSVSRQHAKISITDEDTLFIEDLRSRNGVLVNNEKLQGKRPLTPSLIVITGTTSFVVYDREGEMQTIISPLMPSIVKVLQHDEEAKKEERASKEPSTPPPVAPIHVPKTRNLGPYIFLTSIIALLALGAFSTYSLFKSEPIVVKVEENPTQHIDKVMALFPSVKYSFNPATGSLLLIGHVSTLSDKNQLAYNLQSLPFIKTTDDTGLVIDEYVWREINSVLSRNPAWMGISIHSPTAGEFVLSGYLENRHQAEQLSDYLSLNFPYLDLLKNQVVVQEDVLNQITSWLNQEGIQNVKPTLTNGEINLAGTVPEDKNNQFDEIIIKIRDIPGVRSVNDLTKPQTAQTGFINITDRYVVSGQSKVNDKYTAVINGRILSENDVIDGMTIIKITPNAILLEDENAKYRIDYNK